MSIDIAAVIRILSDLKMICGSGASRAPEVNVQNY
jgi:hypothetical protein